MHKIPGNLRYQYKKSPNFKSIFNINIYIYINNGSTLWRSWLRQGATNRKVAGSIPHGVTGIFIDIILPAAIRLWGRLIL